MGCVVEILVYVTLLFAVSFMCGVKRRRSFVLGTQQQWPSDAFCLLCGDCCVLGGDVSRADDVFFVQLGIGTTTQRSTPVGVGGLSSNILMIALGYVRIVVIAEWLLFSFRAITVFSIDDDVI